MHESFLSSYSFSLCVDQSFKLLHMNTCVPLPFCVWTWSWWDSPSSSYFLSMVSSTASWNTRLLADATLGFGSRLLELPCFLAIPTRAYYKRHCSDRNLTGDHNQANRNKYCFYSIYYTVEYCAWLCLYNGIRSTIAYRNKLNAVTAFEAPYLLLPYLLRASVIYPALTAFITPRNIARGSLTITVKLTVIIMIAIAIITLINTVFSFRNLSRWFYDHRCTWHVGTG